MTDCVLKFSLLLLAVSLVCGTVRAASPEAKATVVIYNSADPSSVSLAKYYAQRREIPDSQLLGLALPATEEISRAEFRSSIADPVRNAFVRNGWWTMGETGWCRPRCGLSRSFAVCR